jgi:RNA-directed DNA polymerase
MTLPLFVDNQNLKTPHSEEFFIEINNYKEGLEKSGLPVIFSLPHLCLLAGVNIVTIKNICDSERTSFYKRFKLKKKRGGFRVIQTPIDELKFLQKWILIHILSKVSSHDSCKGFDIGSSIKNNAEVHLDKPAILKMDLMRFYDSINEKRVYGIFKRLGYHPNLCVSFAKICTALPDANFIKSFKKNEYPLKEIVVNNKQGILPQGAPSSPKISNLIAKNLDNRLQLLAEKNGVKYSRYADDLTFSGELDTLRKVEKTVARIVKSENLFTNHAKTKFLVRGNPFFITGLSVHNSKVTVPKKRKIEIEHHLYNCLKNGVLSHLSTAKIQNRNFKDWLLGSIAFVHSVEKDLGEKYFQEFNKIQWPL